MPVEVIAPAGSDDPDAREPAVVTVKHICEGCEELIRTFKALSDSTDESGKPIHDNISCERMARNAAGGSDGTDAAADPRADGGRGDHGE